MAMCWYSTGATPPAATILDGLRTHKRGVVRLLQVAAAEAKRPMHYLVGEAAVAPPVTASATEGARAAITLPLLDDLVDRLAVAWAKPTPWQRVVNPVKALPYLKARAGLTFAPLDPVRGICCIQRNRRTARRQHKHLEQEHTQ